MNLSPNFTLKEFTNSNTALRNGFKEQFTPPQNIIENLKILANEIAEPIRKQFGSFSPTVAYRCQRLNDIIPGAAKKSQHLLGQAFDETFLNGTTEISDKVFFWLIENKDSVKFTKLIWEKGDVNMPDWLHIGVTKGEKQEVLVFDGKKYTNYFLSKYYKSHKDAGKVK